MKLRTLTTLTTAAILGLATPLSATTQTCQAIAVNQHSVHEGTTVLITTESGAKYVMEGVEDEKNISTVINIDSPAVDIEIVPGVDGLTSLAKPSIVCETIEEEITKEVELVEDDEIVEEAAEVIEEAKQAPAPVFETIEPVTAVKEPVDTHVDEAPPAKPVVGSPTYTG